MKLPNEDVVNISKNATKEMLELPRGKRPGFSGGLYVPSKETEFDSLHCSPITKQDREFSVGDKAFGAACKISYVNKSGRVVTYHSVYQSPLMTRNTKEKKETI